MSRFRGTHLRGRVVTAVTHSAVAAQQPGNTECGLVKPPHRKQVRRAETLGTTDGL